LEYVEHIDLSAAYRKSNNAYKQYIATRPIASARSNKRAKTFKTPELKLLKDFLNENEKPKEIVKKKKGKKVAEVKPAVDPEEFKNDFLSKIRNYRPNTTIFELNPRSNSKEMLIMVEKREKDEVKIEKHKRKMEEIEAENKKVDKKSKRKKIEDRMYF
jgi:ATP-dependent RNA helicase DDX54/DBP10